MTIRGSVDAVRDNIVLGWAAAVDDRSGECRLVVVEVLVEGKVIAQVRADRFRADLKAGGIGTGAYGFEIPLPGSLRPSGLFVVEVRAGREPSVELGRVAVLHGEAAEFLRRLDMSPLPSDADLDSVLYYIRSVSYNIILRHAEEVRSELGDAALVAYLFGRLLERMPDRGAYENYRVALKLGQLDTKGFMAEILESQEYKSRLA